MTPFTQIAADRGPADDLLLAALPPALQIQPYALERLADGRIVLTPYEGR